MFLDKNKPSMNELIYWFQVNYTDLADAMKNSNHNVVSDEPNPYHIEDTIWSHVMLVCQRAEIASDIEYNKIQLICALLHDIGKPASREIIPFEKPKPAYSESNELRNNGINNGQPSELQKTIPKSGLKAHFRGHEAVSFYLAINILNELEKLEVINEADKIQILWIVSSHGTLFDSIDSEGNMRKETKVFDKFVSEIKIQEFITSQVYNQ